MLRDLLARYVCMYTVLSSRNSPVTKGGGRFKYYNRLTKVSVGVWSKTCIQDETWVDKIYPAPTSPTSALPAHTWQRPRHLHRMSRLSLLCQQQFTAWRIPRVCRVQHWSLDCDHPVHIAKRVSLTVCLTTATILQEEERVYSRSRAKTFRRKSAGKQLILK